ncbi:hypothetical protein FN846DRAFT_818155 [Sphaerosporella brunnea]|uniref:Uncharacterized protein n=1 Tax=Sphaerosporella brunnea TaxID=1250544 RepID=A0A5J5EK16_9PEZI|nr:hypothetical protein FN846DRAFT_818155 [Sphaerosporella brunnea]
MGDSRHFSIAINNRSGGKKNYAIFTAAPNVTPSVDGMWTSIIAVLRGVANGSGDAFFSVPKQVYAICGTRNSDMKAQFINEVLDRRQVSLGIVSSNGKLEPGTALEVEVSDGSPTFTTGTQPPPSGDEHAFCVRTRPGFTLEIAKEGNYILGVGGAPNKLEQKVSGSYAFFIPHPNVTYQIKPSNVFYIASVSGEVQARRITTPDLISSACVVDFDILQTDDIQVVHDANGQLVVQTVSIFDTFARFRR